MDITSVKEYSGAPYNYGSQGWSHYEEEPGGWSWRGLREEGTYGLDSTLFLTDKIEKNVKLQVDFIIKSIDIDPVLSREVNEDKDGIYFTYYDSDLSSLKSHYYNAPQPVSLIVKQGKVFWPTSNVTSQGGFIISPEELQQFYFLPSISLGTATRCIISEISVSSTTTDYPTGSGYVLHYETDGFVDGIKKLSDTSVVLKLDPDGAIPDNKDVLVSAKNSAKVTCSGDHVNNELTVTIDNTFTAEEVINGFKFPNYFTITSND